MKLAGCSSVATAELARRGGCAGDGAARSNDADAPQGRGYNCSDTCRCAGRRHCSRIGCLYIDGYRALCESTNHWDQGLGFGRGVGRALGVGRDLGVGVGLEYRCCWSRRGSGCSCRCGVGVAVGVAVAVGVGVAEGAAAGVGGGGPATRENPNVIDILLVLTSVRVEIEGGSISYIPTSVVGNKGDVIADLVLVRIAFQGVKCITHRHIRRPRDTRVGAIGVE